MLDHYFNRIGCYTALTDDEKTALKDSVDRTLHYDKGEDIVRTGSEPESVHIIYDGWASRYKLLENGREHIVAYLIPGDMCDVHITLLKRMDHSIRAESSLTVGTIDEASLNTLMRDFPRLARAMFWSMMVDESIAREWLINLAGRSAEVRIAHLFCELFVRSKVAGLALDGGFYCPINQAKLSESMGLSSVHTNRVLQSLRQRELIVTRAKFVEIPDWPRLKSFADFDADYLHMGAGH